MQEKISPPAAVRALDLVDAVWPAEEKPRPEVISLSPASIAPRIPRYGVHSSRPFFLQTLVQCTLMGVISAGCHPDVTLATR